jgi:fructosamine-3-kinase
MIPDDILQAMAMAVSGAVSAPVHIRRAVPVTGGDINACYRLQTDGGDYFAKLNAAARLDMFEGERDGLTALAGAGALRVPAPVCCARAGNAAFLVMEYIRFGADTADSAVRLGRGLAAMHGHSNGQFGWHRDNHIGTTSQANAWDDDWPRFFGENRLAHQLRLAAGQGHGGELQRLGERLIARMSGCYAGYRPVPSLLHGDLWGGNHATDGQGRPVIFDPAVYYGDREAELAMTELFGGFPERFYAAYREFRPLDAGYGHRKTLYNLYHVLNHANLFGGAYAAQALRMIQRLLSELG